MGMMLNRKLGEVKKEKIEEKDNKDTKKKENS